MDILIVLIGGLVAILSFLIGYYNRFITLRNKVQNGWADIDTQLKKRYNLIPNLVNTVQGYADHEGDTFKEITTLRNQAIAADAGASGQAKAEDMLTGALKSLFAVAEAYPDLKANTNFLDLQETLEKVEEDISLARRYYNALVEKFNTALQTFPGNMIAGLFGFKSAEFFEAEDGEREKIDVKF